MPCPRTQRHSTSPASDSSDSHQTISTACSLYPFVLFLCLLLLSPPKVNKLDKEGERKDKALPQSSKLCNKSGFFWFWWRRGVGGGYHTNQVTVGFDLLAGLQIKVLLTSKPWPSTRRQFKICRHKSLQPELQFRLFAGTVTARCGRSLVIARRLVIVSLVTAGTLHQSWSLTQQRHSSEVWAAICLMYGHGPGGGSYIRHLNPFVFRAANKSRAVGDNASHC